METSDPGGVHGFPLAFDRIDENHGTGEDLTKRVGPSTKMCARLTSQNRGRQWARDRRGLTVPGVEQCRRRRRSYGASLFPEVSYTKVTVLRVRGVVFVVAKNEDAIIFDFQQTKQKGDPDSSSAPTGHDNKDMLLCYNVRLCTVPGKHDWQRCNPMLAHGQQRQRRDPYSVWYDSEPCAV